MTASVPPPSEARVEHVGSSSKSEESLPATSKVKEISMFELSKLSSNVNPNMQSVMNIKVMLKIRDVLGQELLNTLVGNLRFRSIDPAEWKVVGEFRRELSPNEAHSYAYLLQHEDLNAQQKEVRAKVNDLRSQQ